MTFSSFGNSGDSTGRRGVVHVRSDIALVHAAKDRYGNPMDTRFTSVEREKPYGER